MFLIISVEKHDRKLTCFIYHHWGTKVGCSYVSYIISTAIWQELHVFSILSLESEGRRFTCFIYYDWGAKEGGSLVYRSPLGS